MKPPRSLVVAALATAAAPDAGAVVPSTSRQSLSPSGAQLTRDSYGSAVSDNGRWVAFESAADFLPGDTNAVRR